MKTKELRKEIIDNYMRRWLYGTGSSYKINEDFSVDVSGHVWMNDEISKIPFKFGIVGQTFRCESPNLVSLENCPDYVGDCLIIDSLKLNNLFGLPKEIRNDIKIDSRFKEEEIRKICKVGNVR